MENKIELPKEILSLLAKYLNRVEFKGLEEVYEVTQLLNFFNVKMGREGDK